MLTSACSLTLFSPAAGVVSALGYEIIAHKSLAVQIREAPLLIAATFLVIIVATLVRLKQIPGHSSPVNWFLQLGVTMFRHMLSSDTTADGRPSPAGAHPEGRAPTRFHGDGWTRPWPVLRC